MEQWASLENRSLCEIVEQLLQSVDIEGILGQQQLGDKVLFEHGAAYIPEYSDDWMVISIDILFSFMILWA